MRNTCFFLTAILLLFPGETLFAGNAKTFPEERHYTHPLFRTAEECKKAQHGGMWFNCNQSISFYTDGKASVMMTDIMNTATYEVIDRKVIVKTSSAGDMPEEMTFTLDSTGRNLISEGPVVWELENVRSCEH